MTTLSLPTSVTIQRLQEQPDQVKIKNQFASATISLFGAHLLSFNNGTEKIWLSKQAIMDGSKAIRGGIPLCWPWFGNKEGYSSHGFARTSMWQLIEAEDKNDATLITLRLPFNSHQDFPYEFDLKIKFVIGKTLTVSLITENIGNNPLPLTAALHTYFQVSNIEEVTLEGLKDSKYLDKLDQGSLKSTPFPYAINQSTDRIHLVKSLSTPLIDNSVVTKVDHSGHDSIVVWNPWKEIAEGLSDMENQAYKEMLCVETAITQSTNIAPGQIHILEQQIQ